ncbi:hypothetical protein L1887_16208 [Cichorium endivia]|nr:hypothetical protein L1887_16208 [Cichorium endivia]
MENKLLNPECDLEEPEKLLPGDRIQTQPDSEIQETRLEIFELKYIPRPPIKCGTFLSNTRPKLVLCDWVEFIELGLKWLLGLFPMWILQEMTAERQRCGSRRQSMPEPDFPTKPWLQFTEIRDGTRYHEELKKASRI